MKADDLKVNQLIEIEVEELQDIMYLPSRIEEVEDGFIHVSVPMYRGAIVPMRVGQMARVRFNYNDSTYVFSSPITARKWNKIPLLILKKPQEFTKIQRRGHWRIDVVISVKYRPAGEDTPFLDALTLDISGGGVLMRTENDIEAGQILEMEINLPEREPVFCQARVIRLLEKKKREGQANKAALEFHEISEAKRDKIINFIFAKQREWIRKGLLLPEGRGSGEKHKSSGS